MTLSKGIVNDRWVKSGWSVGRMGRTVQVRAALWSRPSGVDMEVPEASKDRVGWASEEIQSSMSVRCRDCIPSGGGAYLTSRFGRETAAWPWGAINRTFLSVLWA